MFWHNYESECDHRAENYHKYASGVIFYDTSHWIHHGGKKQKCNGHIDPRLLEGKPYWVQLNKNFALNMHLD